MLRLVRRHGLYVAFAALSLALTVGATFVVFTIVNALWLRPSPFPNPGRLVVLVGESTSSAESAVFGGVENVERWRAFESIAGQVATSAALAGLTPRVTLDGAGSDSETVGVTSHYFRTLGLSIRGRDFTRDDNRYGAEPVAIISDSLWTRAFDRRQDVIGAIVAASPVPLRIIGVAPAITLLTLVLAAWLPIARFTRERIAGELIGATATTSASSHTLRQSLLAVHVGATIVVLVAAGLFVRAVQHGFSDGAGFDVDRTLFVHVQLAAPFVADDADMDARDALMESRRRKLEDGLRSLPGVEVVALGRAPLGPDQVSLLLASRTVATRGQAHDLRIATMNGSPDLVHALGVPLLAGRTLAAEDATARPRRVLVTESLARALWPDGDALGQILTSAPPAPGASVPDARSRLAVSEVVGVVADFVYGTLADPPAGVLVNVRPGNRGMLGDFVVRSSRPDLMKEPIRRLIQDVTPGVTRLVMETGREVVAQDLGRQRLGAWFFSDFGLIALLLGAAGVFGLVAYLAESRRREFGVQLALGATPGDLVRRGIAAGLLPVGAGVAAGLLAAALVARVFAAVLPGLSAVDPVTYTGVAFLMLGCALAAALTAAWRLRHIAPADALRAE